MDSFRVTGFSGGAQLSVVLPELHSPSSHSFDSGMRMVVASRPAGATIEVNRRSFIKNSLVTGSCALLASRGFAAGTSSSQEQVPGAVAPSASEGRATRAGMAGLHRRGYWGQPFGVEGRCEPTANSHQPAARTCNP